MSLWIDPHNASSPSLRMATPSVRRAMSVTLLTEAASQSPHSINMALLTEGEALLTEGGNLSHRTL